MLRYQIGRADDALFALWNDFLSVTGGICYTHVFSIS
jgi:hypothetical protein